MIKIGCSCGNNSMFDSCIQNNETWILCQKCGKQKKLTDILISKCNNCECGDLENYPCQFGGKSNECGK